MVSKINTAKINVSGNKSKESSFSKMLSISQASSSILSYMRGKGMNQITGQQIKEISENSSGKIPSNVSEAARYLQRHPDIFTAIETHDIAKPDGLAGYLNFQWSSSGALDKSPIASIAKMQDTFDIAIEKSEKITEISTVKKSILDSTKQRPSN